MLIIAFLATIATYFIIDEIFMNYKKAFLFMVISTIDILSWWDVNKPIGIVCLIVFGLCNLVIILVYILTYTGKNDSEIEDSK